jgi:hypothetical protein
LYKENKQLEYFWNKIYDEFKPDIVHLHGTEYAHGLSLFRVIPREKIMVSIQGLTSAIAEHYNAGISIKEELRHMTPVNLYLKNTSTFTGAINSEGAAGSVYVEIEEGSRWVLTGDSYITGLTCGADAIDLNGYTLHVGDQTYEAGTESTGEAIEFTTSSGSGNGSGAPDGKPGENGENGGPGGDGSTPPEKPDGGKPDGKPGRKSSSSSDTTSTEDTTGDTSGDTAEN